MNPLRISDHRSTLAVLSIFREELSKPQCPNVGPKHGTMNSQYLHLPSSLRLYHYCHFTLILQHWIMSLSPENVVQKFYLLEISTKWWFLTGQWEADNWILIETSSSLHLRSSLYAKLTQERRQYIGGPVGSHPAESGSFLVEANLLPGCWAEVGSFSRLRKGNFGPACSVFDACCYRVTRYFTVLTTMDLAIFRRIWL